MKKNSSSREMSSGAVRRKTILAFVIFIGGFALAIAGWKWLNRQPKENGQLKPLRTVLKANEKVNAAFYSKEHLAKEYSESEAAKRVRVNGNVGLTGNFDPAAWELIVSKHPEDANDTILKPTLNAIKALPEKEVIFDFKCIEGWSQVSHWGGTKFSDFLTKYKLGTHSGKAPDANHPEDLYKYVGLMTPDKKYYVGIDMKSMLQPQTILCYEMNGKPLPDNQGYPLRLIIPVKYGIKSLKRIGYIYFSDEKPKDYWHERGYDYDAAL